MTDYTLFKISLLANVILAYKLIKQSAYIHEVNGYMKGVKVMVDAKGKTDDINVDLKDEEN